ncbi:hypothetical protein K439DRAFT_1623889 [Ramaria rubella]|nr:hypothetical protein K439DRAFT_1623889 [Ramaria rubella]
MGFLSTSWTLNDAEESDKTVSDDVKKDDKAVTQKREDRGEWDSNDETYIRNFRYFILDMLLRYCPAKLPFGSDYYQNLTLPVKDIGPSGSPHSGHRQVARGVLMLKSLTGHIVVHATPLLVSTNHLVLASLSQRWIQDFNVLTIRPRLNI